MNFKIQRTEKRVLCLFHVAVKIRKVDDPGQISLKKLHSMRRYEVRAHKVGDTVFVSKGLLSRTRSFEEFLVPDPTQYILPAVPWGLKNPWGESESRAFDAG